MQDHLPPAWNFTELQVQRDRVRSLFIDLGPWISNRLATGWANAVAISWPRQPFEIEEKWLSALEAHDLQGAATHFSGQRFIEYAIAYNSLRAWAGLPALTYQN